MQSFFYFVSVFNRSSHGQAVGLDGCCQSLPTEIFCSILYCQNENVIFLLDLLQTDHAFCVEKVGGGNNRIYYLIRYWQLNAISSLSVSNICTSVKVSGLTKDLKFSWSHKVGWHMHWGICSEVFVHRGIAVDSREICLLGTKQG